MKNGFCEMHRLVYGNWHGRSKSAGGGGGGGRGGETGPGTEKRCSHDLQSDPLGNGFKKGRYHSVLGIPVFWVPPYPKH